MPANDDIWRVCVDDAILLECWESGSRGLYAYCLPGQQRAEHSRSVDTRPDYWPFCGGFQCGANEPTKSVWEVTKPSA